MKKVILMIELISVAKFLSHIINISCQSTDIIRSITHFQYFLAIFV